MTVRSGLSLSLALLAAACARTEVPEEPPAIRIGLLALLSGMPAETSGQPSIEGAELAVQEANEKGGVAIGGVPHHLELIVEAYQDRPDSATSVARTLINRSRIDVLLGPQFSRHAIPVSRVAEDAQIPMLAPMSSSPTVTEGKEFVFRLAFLDEVQGTEMARFAAHDLGARRAAVLYDVSTVYGRSVAQAFRESFESLGGTVAAFVAFARDEPMDYREKLAAIAAARPDVLYLPNDAERVEVQIAQSRESGVTATILGGDSWDLSRFVGMRAAEGAYVAHQWHPDLDTPEAVRFRVLFEKTYGKPPKATAAMNYDAVKLILDAIARAGSKDPFAIRDALAGTGSFTGATGTIRFRNGPDPLRSVVIARIAGGRSTLHKVIDPGPPEP